MLNGGKDEKAPCQGSGPVRECLRTPYATRGSAANPLILEKPRRPQEETGGDTASESSALADAFTQRGKRGKPRARTRA